MQVGTTWPASDRVEPFAVGGENAVDVVSMDFVASAPLLHLVGNVRVLERRGCNRHRLGADVVGDGDARFVAIVDLVHKTFDESGMDPAKDLASRLINLGRMRDGNRPLQDRDPLRILVEDCIDVLGLPKGILLEPCIEASDPPTTK